MGVFTPTKTLKSLIYKFFYGTACTRGKSSIYYMDKNWPQSMKHEYILKATF